MLVSDHKYIAFFAYTEIYTPFFGKKSLYQHFWLQIALLFTISVNMLATSRLNTLNNLS